MRKIVFGLLLVASGLVLPMPSAQAASHDVHISDGVPQPAQLNVADGDTVFFVNDDAVAHAIFGGGGQLGPTIPPHETGGPYGPFTGEGSQYAYNIDRNTGPCGAIVVGNGTSTVCAPPPATTTTHPVTATTHPATTTTAAPIETTTTTLLPPETTTASTTTTTTTEPTTTTSSETAAAAGDSSSNDGDSSNGVRIAGVALLMVGTIGLVIALASQRRHATPAAATAPPEPLDPEV